MHHAPTDAYEPSAIQHSFLNTLGHQVELHVFDANEFRTGCCSSEITLLAGKIPANDTEELRDLSDDLHA